MWLYPELLEKEDLNFKDALTWYLALYNPEQNPEVEVIRLRRKKNKKRKEDAAKLKAADWDILIKRWETILKNDTWFPPDGTTVLAHKYNRELKKRYEELQYRRNGFLLNDDQLIQNLYEMPYSELKHINKLLPEKTEGQLLREDKDKKELIKKREDAGKLYRQRKRDERDERIANKTATPAEIKEAEEEKQRIEEAEEERLEKKTMELKKQTRDKERDNAIKNDEFEKYKFTEPLYVGDIVKVSGYVGRIISSEYPRYHVRTFHDGNSVWCARVSLFRLIPESDDIAYRDDYGDKTYDDMGYKHGYYDAERDGWWEYGDPPDQHR